MRKTKSFIQYLNENGGRHLLSENLIIKSFAVGHKNRFNSSYAELRSEIAKVQAAASTARNSSEIKEKINALAAAVSSLGEALETQADLSARIIDVLVASALFSEDFSKTIESYFARNQRR